MTFTNPVGLAAGMDKDGRALNAWNALGFGFAEVGTITPHPQFGNPRPRMWRLPQNRALINRLGFPSEGMEPVSLRLERWRERPARLRLAINFGPNKDTPAEEVSEDYARLTRWLGRTADFIVINLSSPNTPGLRDFQAPERMRHVVQAVRVASAAAGRAKPLLIKVAPDLDHAMLNEIAAAALELQLDGIVATNTSLQRETLGIVSLLQGGLSGRPLAPLARSVIAQLYRTLRGRVPIIGVGGIASTEDAYEHIRAGANLVELYTGLIYEGPSIVTTIKTGLACLLARDGFRSINDAIGVANEP
jgi:dihydroorotate dehydrogenase